MSNASLELGGGNWAAKDGKLLGYAVGDTSGKYLPREFTFSRGADIAATRVKKGGLIEKFRENILLQSNQFDTTWSLDASMTLTSGQSGYDGSSDAWLLDKTAIQFRAVRQIPVHSNVVTFSVYAKQGTLRYLNYYSPAGDAPQIWFDLQAGAVATKLGTYIEVKMESVGGGWYRCSVTYDAASGDEVRIYPQNLDGSYGSVAGNIYIQDAQLEQGLVATDYLESGSTTGKAGVLDNLPRIDYKNGSAQLLMEPSRTNLVSNSEGIPEATGAVTRTLNYGAAPDGTTSSLKVQKNGVSGNDRIIISDDLAVSNATTYTASGFVKNIDVADTGVTTIAARVDAGTLFRQGYEWTGSSLATTSYASGGSTSNTILEDYGNGWWRIGFTFTTDGTQLDFEIDVDRRNEYDTTSIETWGWQLEEGGYATSYIPTYGASDTRAQDQAEFDQDVASGAWTIYMDLENFTILSGSQKGSFFFKSLVSPSDSALFFNQSCFGWPNTSSGLSYSCDKLGASGTEFTGKWAATYDGVNTIKIYVDGSLRSTATNVDPNRASGISSGQLQYKGDHEPRKFINDLKIYSKELSQSEAEALTA